jgi:hypothetical protein
MSPPKARFILGASSLIILGALLFFSHAFFLHADVTPKNAQLLVFFKILANIFLISVFIGFGKISGVTAALAVFVSFIFSYPKAYSGGEAYYAISWAAAVAVGL